MSAWQPLAVDELQEDPDFREKLKILKEWVAGNKNLPHMPDEQLCVFLHSCYSVVEDTKSCIQAYCTVRRKAPYLFRDRDITSQELQDILSVVYQCEYRLNDGSGCHALVHGLVDSNPSRYAFRSSMKLFFMAMDACLYLNGIVPGYVLLFDMNGVSLGHLRRLSIGPLRLLFTYVQEANPVRLKEVHVVHATSLIDKLMALLRPFMSSHLSSMIHFHQSMDTLYKHVPQHCLPSDFGGHLDSVAVMSNQLNRKLLDLQPYFRADDEKWHA